MKKIIPIFLLVVLVAASGCIKLFETKEPVATAFAGGTDGLKMSFQDLPETVFTSTPFPITVMVQNAGEAPVKANDSVFLLNNAEIFGLNSTKSEHIAKNNLNLASTKLVGGTVVAGGQDFITWKTSNGKLPRFLGTVLTEQQTVPIAIDACYPYVTTMTTNACIARSKKLCEPTGIKVISVSGAPIQITEFKQVAQPSENNNIIYSFTIKAGNMGKGKVYTKTASCPSPSTNDLDKVDVMSVKLGNKPQTVKCDNNNIISLYESEGSMTCTLNISATSDFQDQLAIELGYKYKDRISKSISVIPP